MSQFRSVEKSQTLLINSQSKNLEKLGKPVIKFGFGQSPFLPPSDVLKSLKDHAHRKEYSSVQGDEHLRNLIAQFHYDHNGLDTRPENVVVAPGSKVLLYNILLSYLHLDVLLPGPSWVSYEPQVKLIGHNAIRIRTEYEHRWRVTSDLLEAALDKRLNNDCALILNYPGNPDGLTYSRSELTDIVEVARKHDVLIISDEIYGLLNHSQDHISIGTLYPEKTITTTGLSKWCGAGGWRFGAALLSKGIMPDFKETLLGIGSETYSCAPMPVQMAAKTAYESYQDRIGYLKYQSLILSELSQFASERLNQSGIDTYHGEGGFYLFPYFERFKRGLKRLQIDSSESLAEYLLNKLGVATLPASAFGMNPNMLALRLAYVDFDESRLPVGDYNIKRDFPNVFAGIERICDFVENL